MRILERTPTLVIEAGVVVSWSSAFMGAVLASGTASIYQVLMWRFLIVAMLLLPFLWRAFRYGWRWLLLHGSFGFIGMFMCLSLSIKAIDLGVPAGTAALIGALQPLLSAALAGVLLRETVLVRQWAGLFLGLAGVVMAVGEIGGSNFLSYVLQALGMLCTVANTLLAKAKWDGSRFAESFAFQTLVSALAFAPLAWLDGAFWPTLDPNFVVTLLWMIVFSTAGAYGFYYWCLQRTSVVRLGSLIYLTPPVTMFWAFVMFGQPITAGGIAGLAVGALGVYLARQSAARV